MQTIHLDISQIPDANQPVLRVKQGDVGRKFKAAVTDSGAEYVIPEGAVASVWYSGSAGEGNYTHVGENTAAAINGSEITVELITQMLTVPGGGTLCLVLSSGEGQQLGLWNIHYWVEPVPGADSPGAESYYTAFSRTVEQALAAAEALALPVPVENGGTGATNAATARVNIGLAQFRAYYFSDADGAGGWVSILQENWTAMELGTFLINANYAGSRAMFVGFKVSNTYGAALMFYYSSATMILYRNLNGTWTETSK